MSTYPGPLDKADVLFEADDWMILATTKLAGYRMQASVIGHYCEQFKTAEVEVGSDGHIQFLDEEDALYGTCWWCREEIPEAVQTLWRLQNMDKIPEMNQYNSANSPYQTRRTKASSKDDVSTMKLSGLIFVVGSECREKFEGRNTWKANSTTVTPLEPKTAGPNTKTEWP
jgi:hypothetical protein